MPPAPMQRSLTLIAKVLQSLANLNQVTLALSMALTAVPDQCRLVRPQRGVHEEGQIISDTK